MTMAQSSSPRLHTSKVASSGSCQVSMASPSMVKSSWQLSRYAKTLRSDMGKSLLSLVLLVVLPIRSFCTDTGYINVGFTGSAMAYVDTNGDFLYSPSNTYTLTFFSEIGEYVFYLCIIHAASEQVVWTANRDVPISQSDELIFSTDGNAALVSGGGSRVVWSTNTSGHGVKRMEMQDSGNLRLLDGANNTVWQSFDHPTDTLVNGQVLRPGMTLVGSVSRGNLSSGPYSLSMVSGELELFVSSLSVSPQVYWSMSQDIRIVSSGGGSPSYVLLNSTALNLMNKDGGVISSLPWIGNAAFTRAVVQPDGNLIISVYSSAVWTTQFMALQNDCQLPLFCGQYGVCKSGQCSCPSPLQALNANNVTQGCQPPSIPSCANRSSSGDIGFEEFDGLDYFANAYLLPVAVSGLGGCKQLCIQNCSCTSMFFWNESNACFLFSQLGTIQSTGNLGHSLYVKAIGSPEMGSNTSAIALPRSQGLPSYVLPLIIVGITLLVLVFACLFMYWFFKVHKAHFLNEEDYEGGEDIFLESISGVPTRFTFNELLVATNNFSKKLGEGGFGSVYEGVLPDKTKVAVKRLEGVGQGKKEFRAEVGIIGRIHHMHLVQLYGFCAEGFHRLLVYEFMSHGSLEKHLFVGGKDIKVLDWNTRFQIALGTARGLAYLHDDCREKIIHCDIKPENILLDDNFNAKVSDFGLAKLLNKEQSQVFTTMRGTRGYLAPEWLMNLAISEKSDVYSFGMVLLEIIGGRKNLELTQVSEKCYFPSYAFQRLQSKQTEMLVDERIKGNACQDEVIRAVKVALWCIQEDILARPSMAKVVQMLEGNLKILEPSFSSHFGSRAQSQVSEAMASTDGRSSASLSDVTKSQSYVSAVQLSEAR